MQIDIRKEIDEIADEILAVRREIHMYPEIGNNEFRTASIIETYLNEAGIPSARILETGVVGTIKATRPGKTVALRADIDALPVSEKTGADYMSRVPGLMHACGHDVHTAALLGAAKILSGHRDELAGDVVLIFQPDEEGDGGAMRMIGKGVLNDVDAVFGTHVSPDLPEGTAGFKYGSFYAAADTFDVETTGKGAHGAERGKGADALAAAAKMITELIEIPRNHESGKSVLTVGTFRSGTARNILSDKAEFSGIVRTHGQEIREKARAAFYDAVEKADREYGTRSTVVYSSGYPGVANDESMTTMAEKAAIELLGRDSVLRIEEPTMMTEDFGCYLREVPGCYYHIGAGCDMPLHSSEFLPTDKAVLTAASVHVAVVLEFLSLERLQF